ncbi:26S proteasome non-ATPase regulatory subunit 10-like [Oscarella lobularis]|uniref:26S proteasome non-ATPase regulatory subunit 10-like n=1 Tax=Oscarella lobularis TaxID=121494 RepID=UPI0033144BA7
MPIHLAALNKFDGPSVIQLLLEWGADVNSIDEQFYTPLALAVICCNVNAVRELLAASADVNAITDLQTALIRTAQALNVGVASSTYVPGYFRTLHYAAEANSFQGVKLLLEHGAKPEIGNLKGQMPVDLTKSDVIGSLLRNFKRQFAHR